MTLLDSIGIASTYSSVFFTVIFGAIAFVFLSRRKLPNCPVLPPGPWGLPVLGAAFRLGPEIYSDFVKLSKTYGEMFSMYIGSRLVVVLNGEKLIHEALVKHSAAFAGRPPLYSMAISSFGGRGLIGSSYNKKWKVLRKTSVMAMHKYLSNHDVVQSTLGKNRDFLVDEINSLSGTDHDIMDILKATTAGVILGALFGDRFNKHDFDKILEISDTFRETVGAGMLVDFMPWLRHFPNSSVNRLVNLMQETKSVVGGLYHANKTTYTRGEIRNLADSLLEGVERLAESENQDSIEDLPTEDLDSIVTLIDLFGGGFDTSSITLYFGVAYLSAYPEMQTKMQQELNHVVGRDRIPELDDMEHLHYNNAFCYELLRITSLAPTGIPHSTTCDVEFNGYFIPEGTTIFTNFWSVHHDPKVWKDPEVFSPSRFLDDDGHVVRPKKNSCFMPFSMGRRECPGRYLAEKEIPFLLANLVHHFEFINKELEETKTIKIDIGLTLKPKNFTVLIKRR